MKTNTALDTPLKTSNDYSKDGHFPKLTREICPYKSGKVVLISWC
jgi:hypothetical protein